MTDPKRIVAEGYDRIAERYSSWTGTELRGPRARYLEVVQKLVPSGAEILELGCATGVPVTQALAARYQVTGVDISPRHIELAKINVPAAEFIQADMTALDLPSECFHAVLAFYAITHVPREEHSALLKNIARLLRPGGLFVASLGAGDDPGTVEDDWLGAPMFFSSYDASTNQHLVTEAGFDILSADEIAEDEDGVSVTFLWIVAQKPFDETPGLDRGVAGTKISPKRKTLFCSCDQNSCKWQTIPTSKRSGSSGRMFCFSPVGTKQLRA